MKKLYKFYYDYSNWADFISGMFIEEETVVNQALGKTLLFEFGPNKEDCIEIEFDELCLTEIDVSEEVLKELDKKLKGCLYGHNPLDYIID